MAAKKKEPEPRSFRWFVKNPEGFEEWAQSWWEEKLKASEAESSPPPAKDLNFLIEQLRDPMHRGNAPKKERWDEKTPLEMILDRLEPHAPPEIVPAIADLVRHQDAEVRKTVALALGNIADDSCLEPLSACLTDEDDYVRSYAMMGLGRALDAGRGTPAFWAKVFGSVLPLVDRQDMSVSDASGLLLRLDRDRATKTLLDKRFFTVSNRQLSRVLRALAAAGVPLPADRILPLLDSIRGQRREYPQSYMYVELLKALARTRAPKAEALAREIMLEADHTLYEGGAEALLLSAGIHDRVWECLWQKAGEDSYSCLTLPQRYCLFIRGLDGEVQNGGFSQYFFNSSGDHAKEALEGFKAIGDDYSAGLLATAIALFGKSGPSSDRNKRMKQLSRFDDAKDETLDDLDSQFYENKGRWQCKMAEYVLKNRRHFVPSTTA